MNKPMFNWLKRYFSNGEVIALFLLLIAIVLVFFVFREIMMPILASIVIAYLLTWLVRQLESFHVPRSLAVLIVYAFFLALVGVALFGLLPMLWRQLSNMVNELPNTIGRGQALLAGLPERYPHYISSEQVQEVIMEVKAEGTRFGQLLLTATLSYIPNVIEVIVYLVLVPMLVFFFLMDQKPILDWLEHYLPRRRRLISKVWNEVHTQIGNYVSGKVIEIVIVWFVCYVVFGLMGLKYAMLLSALVGLSALVPYIGAVVVTVPVLIIAFLQWGWTPEFAYLIIAYAIIVTLDANVLVPFLFSEVVALHPVAIIIATLFFGSLWGFWGVFFAIPLATLVKAILKNVLPDHSHQL